MKKVIFLTFYILIFQTIFASNSLEYFKSETMDVKDVNNSIYNENVIKEFTTKFINAFDNLIYDNKIEKYMFQTYSKFYDYGEPVLIYDSEGPWYYEVPLLNNDRQVVDFIIFDPYTGKILSYPSFSESGELRGKYFYKDNYSLKNGIENFIDEEIISDIRRIKILTTNYEEYKFYSFKTKSGVVRVGFDKEGNMVRCTSEINIDDIYLFEKRKRFLNKVNNKIDKEFLEAGISNFNVDYIIPEYDRLPWKNQTVNCATYVNSNLQPTQGEWADGIALKCLSYGASTTADWWLRYITGTDFEDVTYKNILRRNSSGFEVEYGINPRLLELVYHLNTSWLDFDFDFAPFGINCPQTGDEVAFDLKGYCRILTHDNIEYITQSISEPLFGNCPSEFNNYYHYASSDNFHCGNDWGKLNNFTDPGPEDYNAYMSRLKTNGPILIWGGCHYSGIIGDIGQWFEAAGHSITSIGIGSFNGILQWEDHVSEYSDYVLINHDNYGEGVYTPKTLSYGESYFGVWEAYYFHNEINPPVIENISANLNPNSIIFQITFNEPMKPEKLDASYNNDYLTYYSSFVNIDGSESGSNINYNSTYDKATYTVEIIIAEELIAGEILTLTFNNNVQDVAGNSIILPSEYTFIVIDEDNPDPTSIAVSMSLYPSTATEDAAVTVSGSAIYDTGDPVTSGTATISTNENSWTAYLDEDGNFERIIYAPGSSGYVTVVVSDGPLTGNDQEYLTVTGGDDGDNYTFNRSTMCQDVQDDDPWDPIYETHFYRSTDEIAYCWVRLDNLYVSVKVKWEWYNPDGSFFNETFSSWTNDPQDYGYDYYYWWKMWSGYYINGYAQSDNEGRNTVKVFVKEYGGLYTYHESQYYVISYDFKEQHMCKDVQNNDPVNKTNIFNQNDTRAITWMLFEDVSESIEIRWEFYEPNGSLYDSFEHTIEDPGEGYYYQWAKAWGWVWIDGYSAANKCGDWHVKVYEKDPWGSWDEIYNDNFTIEESPEVNPSITVSSSPSNPLENQDITLQLSGTDNTYIQNVILYWNDGTPHSEEWDNIYQGSVSKSKNIGNYAENQTIQYYAKIFDTSGNQNESQHKVITVIDNDTNGPVISDISITEYEGNNNGIIDNTEQVKISCNIQDPSGIQSVHFYIDNEEVALTGNYYSISGPYEVDSYPVRITATDNDNSPASSTIYRNFDVVGSSFTISGYILQEDNSPISNVLLEGLPYNTLTNDDGYYSCNVENGWSGTATPIKEFWNFEPQDTTYSNITSDQTKDYIGTLIAFSISGNINYCGSENSIQNVDLGMTGDTELTASTDEQGYYIFSEAQGNITVTPSKEGTYLDCINGFDMLRLKNYRLEIVELSDCGLHAADANGDGSVNGFDLLRIKNCLLEISCDSPTGEFEFIPESMAYNPITMDMENQNYSGYIYGDVNLSYGSSSSLLAKSTENPNATIFFGQYYFTENCDVSIPIKTDSDLELGMLQWTITYDQDRFEFNSIQSDFLEEGDYNVSDGTIRIIWIYQGEEQKIESDQKICEIILKPINSSSSGYFEFNGSNYLSDGLGNPYSCAYTTKKIDLSILSVLMDGTLPTRTTLLPNYPNPFNPVTTISYYLNEETDVKLMIFNVRGEVINSYRYTNQSPGIYQIEWNAINDKGASVPSGIYFYRMDHGGHSQVKRMLLMK